MTRHGRKEKSTNKLPKSLKICGQMYSVVYVKKGDNKTLNLKWDGFASSPHKKIWIRLGYPKDCLLITLLHEILHCICYETGIDNIFTGHKQKEVIMCGLSTQLLRLFKENRGKI